MMEYWDHSCSIWLKNNKVHGINTPWIEKTSTKDYAHGAKTSYMRLKVYTFKGVVIPGIYVNIYGEIVKIDPKNLDPDTEVMRF